MQKKMFFILALPIVMAACGKSSASGSSTTSCTNIALTALADTTEVITLRNYLNSNNIVATKDTSGIFYQIITPGTDTTSAKYCSVVTVDYVGRVLNDNSAPPFDQTTSATGPRVFNLRSLIAGWQAGIPLIKKGGTIRLFIPPSLGYGVSGATGVPGNAYLKFDISLLDITN